MRFSFLIILILSSYVHGQSPDEIEILNRMLDNSITSIQDFLMRDSIKTIHLKFFTENEKINSLIRSKTYAWVQEDSLKENLVEVVLNKFDIRYPEIVSFPLFGAERLKREIELDISFNFIKNDFVIFNHRINQIYSDTVSVEELIQKSTWKLDDKSKIPEIPLWRRLIEPTIISTATGLIVYLFFTVRSR